MARTSSAAPKHFSVDARTVLALGRDSIKDHTTAILELVKNGYDAGATVVVIEVVSQPTLFDQPFIRITDNGHGMSETDVETKWLRIGYSEKKKFRRAKTRRRRVGEKGIGRLSADRLGAILELRSQAKQVPAIGLQVNWDLFDFQGKDLVSIPLNVLAETTFRIPQTTPFNNRTKSYGETPPPEDNTLRRTGTELTISRLRQIWRPTDLDDLHRELSILTSPFESVKDFQIRLKADLRPELDGVVASPFFQAAEIKAQFVVDSQSKVHCSIMTKDARGNTQERNTETVDWCRFVHRTKSSSDAPNGTNGDAQHANDHPLSDHSSFGPAKVEILFYPRIAETLRGTGLSLGQLKEFLDAHAGMKVYRDNIRLCPKRIK